MRHLPSIACSPSHRCCHRSPSSVRAVADDVDEVERLRGGINEVVRIGDTVRRPIGPWSPCVHELLAHLEQVGFTGAPRWLGTDSDGREVLSLVPGICPWPDRAALLDTAVVAAAARLLRAYHDAVDGWSPIAAHWQVAPIDVGGPEVICHNDVAPWNLIISDAGEVVAFVDWDAAAPGPRAWDIAYLAYRLVPLASPADLHLSGWPPDIDQISRLRAVRDGYRCNDQVWSDVLTALPRRVQGAYDTMCAWAGEDRPGWRAQWEQPESNRLSSPTLVPCRLGDMILVCRLRVTSVAVAARSPISCLP
jgi:hypothetical protein